MKKLLFSLLAISSIFASDLNLEITNETLAGNLNLNLPQYENFQMRGTYLYYDDENKNNYYSVGFGAIGENALDNYNSKLTIFIDYVHTKDNSALPIGIGIFNKNFGNFQHPLFAKAEIAYAPKVLSFDEATKFLKAKVELGIKPIKNAKLFIGYKTISFNKNYLSVGYAGIGFMF